MKYLSYGNSLENDFNTSETEMLKPSDSISARDLNRPLLNIYENSEDIYNTLQSVVKSIYGNKTGIIPDVYECFNPSNLKIGSFMNETRTYIRIPTGLACLRLPITNSRGNTFSAQEDDAYVDDMDKDLFTKDKFHSYFIFNRPNTSLFERELASIINLDITDLNNDIKVYDTMLKYGKIGYRMEVTRETTGALETSYYPNKKENTKWNVKLPTIENQTGNWYIIFKDENGNKIESIMFTPSGNESFVNNLAVSAINLNSSKFTAEASTFMYPYYGYNGDNRTNYFINNVDVANENIYTKNTDGTYTKVAAKDFKITSDYYELVNGEYIEHKYISNDTSADDNSSTNNTTTSYNGFCIKCISDNSDVTNNYKVVVCFQKEEPDVASASATSNVIYERILNSNQKYYTNMFDMATNFLTIYKSSLIKESGFGDMLGLEPVVEITNILPTSQKDDYTIYYNAPLSENSEKIISISKYFGIVKGSKIPDGCISLINFSISKSGVSYSIEDAKFSDGLELYDKRTLYSKRAELNTLLSDTRTDLINYLYFKDSKNIPNREIEIKNEFVKYNGEFVSGTDYYEAKETDNGTEYIVTGDSVRNSLKTYYIIDDNGDDEQIKITSPILFLRDKKENDNKTNQYIKINKAEKSINIVSHRTNGTINSLITTGNINSTVTTGNINSTVTTGNINSTITTGNINLTVSKGNIVSETKDGSISLTTSKGDIVSETKDGSAKIISSDTVDTGVYIKGHTVISSSTNKDILEIKRIEGLEKLKDENILFTGYGHIGFNADDSNIKHAYAEFINSKGEYEKIISLSQSAQSTQSAHIADVYFSQIPCKDNFLNIGSTTYKYANVYTHSITSDKLEVCLNAYGDNISEGALGLGNSNIYDINSIYICSNKSADTNKNTINFCHSENFLNTIQSYYTEGTKTPAGFYFYEGRNYKESIKESVNLLLDLNNTCATFSSHLYISNKNESEVTRYKNPTSVISIKNESLHVQGDSVFNGYVSFEYPITSTTTFNNSVVILGNGEGDSSLTLTKGNISLTKGNISLTKGSIILTEGDIKLTKGDLSCTGSMSCTGNISSGSFNNFKLSGTSITTANETVLDIKSSMTLSEASNITNVGNLHIMNGTYYSLSSINGRSILSSYEASAEYYAPTTSPRSYNGNRNFLTANDGSFGYSQDSLYIDSSGYVHGTRIYNAVWNDFADFTTVPNDTIVEYGKAYILDKNGYHVSNKKAQKGFIGIASDTYGQCAGFVDGKKQIPIAVGGFVLAYTDKIYETGTELVAAKDGRLTKASAIDSIFHRSRIVGIFYKKETEEFFNKTVKVNGRNWVKVY